jgi:hypothetical protein
VQYRRVRDIECMNLVWTDLGNYMTSFFPDWQKNGYFIGRGLNLCCSVSLTILTLHLASLDRCQWCQQAPLTRYYILILGLQYSVTAENLVRGDAVQGIYGNSPAPIVPYTIMVYHIKHERFTIGDQFVIAVPPEFLSNYNLLT